MNASHANNAHASRRWPRFRFSLLTLLVLTTFACVTLAWFILHQKSHVVALMQVSPSTGSYDILQQSHLALLTSAATIQAALDAPNISSLPLVKAQTEPVDWLMRDLAISFVQKSEILAIKLNVPARYSGQGQAVLGRVIEEYLAAATKSDPAQKIILIQPPVITNDRW
jgi:hypothetical protein